MPRDRWSWGLSGATLAMHLAVAGRYDFFRDELYFIACGRRPAFGYVDQPPVVPLLAAASQLFGEHLFVLRALTAIAAAATVFVTIALARLVGAGTFGAAIAGAAAALAPMYMGVMTTVGTSSFEPLMWTLLAYLVTRALFLDDRRAWVWAGVVVGVDLEIKYALPIYLVPLLAAVVVTGRGRALLRREVAMAIALAVVLAAPSAIWQVAHGLPFVQMVQNQARHGKNVVLGPVAFVVQQIMVMNPLFAPVWIAGVAAPFVDVRWKSARFLSLAFALTFAAMMLLHAKDYYVSPLYGVAFAVGGAALEKWIRARALGIVWIAAAVTLSVIAAPMAMPILSPPSLVAYMRALHQEADSTETQKQAAIPQDFADMFGWREYVARVTAAVNALPADERAHAVILAGNYGEAGALDLYGRDLPPVLSGHNQYWMWGTRGLDPSTIVFINRDPDEVEHRCAEARVVDRFGAPWVMPEEDDAPITLCRGVHPPLAAWWPKLQHYY